MTRFLDTVIAGQPRRTGDGYLVADVKAARTGIQVYAGHEVGRPDLAKVRVWRPEEEVFHKDSLASYAHKPAVNGHPPVNVGADNWKDYATGQIGGDVVRDGDHVRVPLVLMDGSAIADYEAGRRQELSMGYSANIEFGDGVTPQGEHYNAKQTNIRINHISQEHRGRAQTARIGDAQWGAAPMQDHEPGTPPKMKQEGGQMTTKTVVLGDRAVQVLTDDAAEVERFKDASAKALQDAKQAHETAINAKDEQIGQLKTELQAAKDAANIDVDALVASRSELVTQVKAIDASIDPSGKTDAQLRKAAVASKFGDAMVADSSDAEITGMYKAIAKDAGREENPVRDAFKQGIQQPTNPVQRVEDAYQKGIDDMNAWRYQEAK